MATFPLALVFELYIDGAWVDITSDVRYETGAAITRGRSDEQSRVTHSRCGFAINNRDGKYSPRNPSSEYYGKIGRNTPFRVRVEDFATTPSLRSAVTTATSTATTYAVAPPSDVVAGDVLIAFQSADAAVLADLTEPTPNPSTVPAPWELLSSAYTDASNDLATKIWWRVAGDDEPASYTFTHNASSDGIVTIAAIKDAGHATPIVAQTLESAPGTSVDTPTTTPTSNNDFELRWVAMTDATGAANTWTAPAALTERSDLQSSTFTTGSLATRALTSGAATGVHTFTASSAVFDSAHGFTVNVMPDEVRFTGEIPSWPPKWDITGTDVYVPIEAAGILRRLGQGASPLRSAIYRGLTTDLADSLVAYWPMEDAAGSLQFASAVEGAAPVKFSSSPLVQPGSSTQLGSGAAPVAVFSSAAVSAYIPAHTATAFTVAGLFYFPEFPNSEIFHFGTSGTLSDWQLLGNAASGELRLWVFDTFGNIQFADEFVVTSGLMTDQWVYLQVSAEQVGSDVSYFFSVETGLESEGLAGTEAAATVGSTAGLLSIGCGGISDVSVGHHFVTNEDVSQTTNFDGYVGGHTGETAVQRMIRLCDEEGIALEVIGESATSEVVGPQRVATITDLLNDAADADQGILYEPRGQLGLAYRTNASLYNQAATLALDYSLAHLSGSLEPVDDDQAIRNDVTAKRLDGSEARAVLETGALSILAPPNGVGRYDEAVTLNVAADSQLEQIASWRRHIGTWDEARYPLMGVNLARSVYTASAALTLSAAKVDLGDYISLDNPPAWLPPDLIEQLAQGLREYLNKFEWSINWNCSPAGPYLVMGVYGTSRYSSADSTLAEDLTTTETLVDVAIVTGLWTTSVGAGFDINVGGERMTVTAISGASSPQTFTVTRSVNGVVKTHSTGAAVSLWRPARYAL